MSTSEDRKLFVFEFEYEDLSLRSAHRDAHVEYLRRLHDDGSVLMAGPFADFSGGMIIVMAASSQDVERLLGADPYLTEGVISARGVREWTPAIGHITQSDT